MRGLPLGIVVHLFIGKARGRTNEFASTAGFRESAQLLREAVKKGRKAFTKARRFAYCRSVVTGKSAPACFFFTSAIPIPELPLLIDADGWLVIASSPCELQGAASNHDPLDLIKTDLIVTPIVETSRTRALVVRYLLRNFQLTAVAQMPMTTSSTR